MHRNTLCPKQNVAVGKRYPEMVFSQPKKDRIIENTAVGIGDEDVFTLANGQIG